MSVSLSVVVAVAAVNDGDAVAEAFAVVPSYLQHMALPSSPAAFLMICLRLSAVLEQGPCVVLYQGDQENDLVVYKVI